jgi:hypothetical protein
MKAAPDVPTAFEEQVKQGLLGAYLVNRFAGGRGLFDRTQNIFKFAFLAAMASTMVSATCGVTSLTLGGFAKWSDYGAIWLTWWLGDTAGDLVVAPTYPCGRFDRGRHQTGSTPGKINAGKRLIDLEWPPLACLGVNMIPVVQAKCHVAVLLISNTTASPPRA